MEYKNGGIRPKQAGALRYIQFVQLWHEKGGPGPRGSLDAGDTLWGYLFFGNLPDLPTLLGAVVIVYGGLYALRLEGRVRPRKAALVILSDEDKP